MSHRNLQITLFRNIIPYGIKDMNQTLYFAIITTETISICIDATINDMKRKIVKSDVTSQSQSPCQRPSLSAPSVCRLDQTEHHPALPSPSTKKQPEIMKHIHVHETLRFHHEQEIN